MMNAETRVGVHDWLVPFLLLCLRDGDLRGQEIMGRMAKFGLGAVRPGELYRELRQAEAEGLVRSERERLGYLLSRRRYGLTESGRAYIEFLADSLGVYREEIENFLRAYVDRPGSGG